MNRRTVAAAIAIAALTAPIKATVLAPTANAVPGCVHDRACHRRVAQGIHDGQSAAITEDSPQWSCVDFGNRICGPNKQLPVCLLRCDMQLLVAIACLTLLVAVDLGVSVMAMLGPKGDAR